MRGTICGCLLLPRRFAKTESFGVSLMDMGVGSFIVTNAFLSNPPRDFNEQQHTLVKHVTKSLRNVFPLVLLGLVRVAAVKGANYQVHLLSIVFLMGFS